MQSGGQTETARCLVSGEERPTAELLPYGEAWVAPEHSDRFVEQVLEGDDPSAASPDVGVRRRALGLAIDFLAKLIPVHLIQLPFVFALADAKDQLEVTSPDDMASMMSTGVIFALVAAKIGQMLISAGYETWMVGRYGATLGKMAVGAKVTLPDGGRVSYGRAALRWAAKTLLNGLVFWTIIGVPLALIAGLLALFVMRGGDVTAILPLILWTVLAIGAVFIPLSLFPWWMAWADPEKRTLHDRVAATRVRERDGESAADPVSENAASVVHCPRCAARLPEDATADDSRCPACGTEVERWSFSGRGERSAATRATIAGAIAAEGEARCRFLPELKAETVCDACGALLSERAATRWGAKAYCLPCVHRLRDRAGVTPAEGGLLAGRTIFDNLALLLVTVLSPVSLLTAPAALFLLIRHRRAPRGLVARGPFRWWLALILALFSLVVWLGLLALGISLMVEALIS